MVCCSRAVQPATVEIAQYRATRRGTLAPVLGEDGINAITRARLQQVLLDGLFARHQGSRAEDGTWIAGSYRLDKNGNRIPLRGEQPRNVMRQLLRFAADRGYRIRRDECPGRN